MDSVEHVPHPWEHRVKNIALKLLVQGSFNLLGGFYKGDGKPLRRWRKFVIAAKDHGIHSYTLEGSEVRCAGSWYESNLVLQDTLPLQHILLDTSVVVAKLYDALNTYEDFNNQTSVDVLLHAVVCQQ
uniref:Phenylalanine--tRNA ligase beta subunit n=1 Tax=Lygus hesperus TaxID=30085 RepID=A0A0A9YH25_LYGHE